MVYYNPYKKRNVQHVRHRSPYEKTETQKRAEALEAKKTQKEDAPSGLVRGLATGGDVLANVYTGALKGVEGIVDLGAGLVGGVGGPFSEDVKEGVRSFIETDITGEYLGGNYLQELTKYSYTNDGKVGEIAENVANALGQMLPTVAVALATGGTSLGASAAQGAAQGLAIGTSAASAAGMSTESALKDGAGLGQALAYGGTMGAVEGVTEKYLGGVDVKTIAKVGKDVAKEAGQEVAKQGGKRIFKEMLEEGAEEAISELVDPAARTIYQGGDALEDYLNTDYWKGVGQAALVGGLTASAYGGTVGKAIHRAKGTNADMDASFDTVSKLQKQQMELHAEDRLDGKQYSDIKANIKENLRNVETVLKKASPDKRAKLIEKYGIDSMFDSDGSMNADYEATLDRQIEAGKSGKMSRYVSPDVASDPDTLNADLEALNNDRAEGEPEVKIFDGELSEMGKDNFRDLKHAAKNLNLLAGDNFNIALVNGDVNFKGVTVKGKNIYINSELVESGDWAGTLVHELTHFAEGSREYVNFMSYLLSDEKTARNKMSELAADGNAYGFTRDNAERFTSNTIDTGAGQNTIRYSKMNNKSFTDNVKNIEQMSDEEAQRNATEANFVSVMKQTPETILEHVKGSENLEVIVRFDALYLATRSDGCLKGHYHNLGADIVSNLPQLISNPDAIIRLENGRVNVLSDLSNVGKKNGVISIELNTVKDINSKYGKYNLVVSAFSAKDN